MNHGLSDLRDLRGTTVVLALLLLGASSAVAQADARAMQLLRTWVLAVQQHTPGEVDRAATSIAAWSRADIEWVHRYIQTLVEFSVSDKERAPSQPLGRMAPDLGEIRALAKIIRSPKSPSDFPKRAAILHSDIVMLVSSDSARVEAPKPVVRGQRTNRETTPLVSVRSPDGRMDGYELGNLHWEVARSALRPIAADEDVRRWYHAVAAYFANDVAYGELPVHLERALAAAPNDAWLLYDSGCHQETLAAPMMQEFVRITTLPAGYTFLGVTSASGHWQRAEVLYRRALDGRQDFPEARLRLGRVLHKRARHAEALAELNRADQESASPSIKYFAALFKGDVERSLDHPDLARANYDAAVAWYPQAQAARVALSHLLRETGDRAGAMATLEPVLADSDSRTPADDPWWEYHRCEGPYLEPLYEQVIAPFLKERGH